MNNQIYTIAQSASYLQVCDKTVRRLIAKEELIASKVGNSWRIQKRDIDLYLEKTQNKQKYDITE